MTSPTNAILSKVIPLQGSTRKQFLVIALGIAQQLDWDIESVSDAGIIAYRNLIDTAGKVKVIIAIERYSATIWGHGVQESAENAEACERAIVQFTFVLYNSNHMYSSLELAAQYEELKPHLVPPQEAIVNEGSSSFEESKAELLSVFTPKAGYFVTPWLIIINTLIFLITVFYNVVSQQSYTETMVQLGASSRPAILKGQWWRLLASTLLHWDVVHLFMNMVALYIIGLYLEPYVGKVKFTAAYLLTGVVASVVSVYWHADAVSAGASGAIFGLYGVFLALLTTSIIKSEERQYLLLSISVFVVYNLLSSMRGNADNAAHLGGLVCGVLSGYIIYAILRRQTTAEK